MKLQPLKGSSLIRGSMVGLLLGTFTAGISVAGAADHPIAVRVQNKAVPAGGRYFQP